MTERVQSQYYKSPKRGFFRRMEEVTLSNKVRSSDIRKSLIIEPLLLRIKRSQLRWFDHVNKIPQERLPKQGLLAEARGKRPVLRPTIELDGQITLRILDGIIWDFTQAKWWRWWKTVTCGGLISSCCLCNPHGKANNDKGRINYITIQL